MPSVLLSESMAVELGAAEPWSEDTKLFQPFEVEQILLPDNASSRSVQAFLNFCSLNYQVDMRSNAEQMSPSGHIPFIKCGQFVLSEMGTIVSFVNNKGVNISSHLSEGEKGDMQAYISLVENIFGAAELYVSWCHEETFKEVTYPRYTSAFPWPLDRILCWQKQRAVKKKLECIGWAEKTYEQVLSEVEDTCQALSERLNNRAYFFGEKPTELDALVYGHLSAIMATPLPDNSLDAIIRENEKLVDLCTRISSVYFNGKL
ncbi:Metaxin-2 [Halotydeus destructor]|nr:Metaxin-2 [Halotydeus destructor]